MTNAVIFAEMVDIQEIHVLNGMDTLNSLNKEGTSILLILLTLHWMKGNQASRMRSQINLMNGATPISLF